MRKLGLGIALAAGVVSLSIGCGVPQVGEVDEAAVGTQSSPIIDGTASGKDHDSVVLIVLRNRGACTGTLVAPNLVLTARHCVTETDEGALCKTDGTAYQGGELYSDFAPTDLLIYPGQGAVTVADSPKNAAASGKQIITESTSTYCDADVAFILLDRPVSAPVAPMRLKEGAREGELITAVGWGLTESGRIPSKRMERSGIRVQAVGPYSFDDQTRIGLADSEFLIGEGFCSGDSGGPAFASTGAVVGVVSRGGNGSRSTSGADGCIGADTIGIYTHLARKTKLVERAFKTAGYTPRDEGTPPGKAAGDSCWENVDCSSNTCVSGTCRNPCSDDGDCASDETCATKGEFEVCMPKPEDGTSSSDSGDGENGAAPARKTTKKTTTTGCSSAPGSRGAPVALSALVGLGLAFVRRRRRR